MATLTTTTTYAPVTPAIVSQLQSIVGDQYVFTDAESLEDHSHDWTEDLSYLPEVVVKPASTAEIAQLLKLCNRERIPATPVGARTGLSGGALPVHGGVVIAIERLNKLIELDTGSLQVTVQPGVTTQEIQESAEEQRIDVPTRPFEQGQLSDWRQFGLQCGGGTRGKVRHHKDYVLA